jgi:centromeric protein E
MAATLPRPSRPSLNPPTSTLPSLPTPKSIKTTGLSTSNPTTPQNGTPSGSYTHLPSLKPGKRMSSTPGELSTPKSSFSGLPTLNAADNGQGSGRTIRRSVSIAAFPNPPNRGSRIASLQASPLSSSSNLAGAASAARGIGGIAGSRRGSSDATSPVTPGQSRVKSKKTLSSSSHQYSSVVGTPSLLNGSGDSKSISSGPGARGSDCLLSLPSPPQSRSSSAQGSYSTNTTLDEAGEPRGREGHDEAHGRKRDSDDKMQKGNVLVSVRVRPDAGNGDNKSEGDWTIDGRHSRITFNGREGGEYTYGTFLS